MDTTDIQKSLEVALSALGSIKEHLQNNNQHATQSFPAELPSVLGQAIANITLELNRVASGEVQPTPQQAQQTEAFVKALQQASEGVMNPPPSVPRQIATAPGEKLIEVPVRQRTGTATQSGPVPATRTFTLELPATPFHPKIGVTPAKGAPPSTSQHRPTSVIPASTPMAAEVLASLYALGLQFPPLQPTPMTHRSASAVQAAAQTLVGLPPLGRRAAAIKAAETSAVWAPRPRVKKENSSINIDFEEEELLPDDKVNGQKTCNCKRSQCLKLYCECFSASGYCHPSCQCINCLNTPKEVDNVKAARAAILAKNSKAFKDKIVGDSHKKGCRCKRSKCLKKYCECYNAGIKCNPEICQCDGCHNGAPDGYEHEDFKGDEPIAVGGGSTEQVEVDEEDYVTRGVDENINVENQPLAHPPYIKRQQQVSYIESALMGVEDNNNNKGLHAATSPSAPPAVNPAMQQPISKPNSTVAAPQTQKLPHTNAIISTPGGPLRAGTSALTSHLSDMGIDGDMMDTAASPALHAAAIRARLVANERRLAAATMTGGGATKGAGHPSQPNAGDGHDGSRNKRPRRAASGGVQGAVAAARADWGLDLISPPPKRSHSLPDMGTSDEKGTAAAVRKESRNSLLRRAIHNDAANPSSGNSSRPQPRSGVNEADADAVSVLVSLHAM